MEENANPIVIRRKMSAALSRFETLTGLTHLFTPTWTFWNAMFLAGKKMINDKKDKTLFLITSRINEHLRCYMKGY